MKRISMMLSIGLILAGLSTQAEVKLPSVFQSNMVLQRGMKAPVWGWAAPGEKVSVEFNGVTVNTVATSKGDWKTAVVTGKAGGPFTFSVSGKSASGEKTNQISLDNVMVGDVWICSGQSNMEMGIGVANNPKEEIAAANYPGIRLIRVPNTAAETPRTDFTGDWKVCSPETIGAGGWGGFSAAGYFFGRELYKKYNVPIGLIMTCWGGTPAESWTSLAMLKSEPDLAVMLGRIPQTDASGKPAKSWDSWTPTGLYNGMIAPLLPYGIKGAIWYQGESNAGRAFQYRKLMPAMITNWRKAWGQGNFSFFMVQLANFTDRNNEPVDSDWAELREAQNMTLSLPKTGIACIIDIGDAKDIHPKNKQEVGRRLAISAMNVAYGDKTVEGFCPMYKSMTVKGSSIVLTFSHAIGGLKVSDERKPTGFAVAGEDKKFHWADAKIVGSTVVVSNTDVPIPVAVRYGWSNNPDVNVTSKEGLPLSPFRTDIWPGVTVNNK